MTLIDTFEGVTVRETPDLSALAEIYPLRPTNLLTGPQEHALEEATDAAMCPLVEAAWARRGVTVRWSRWANLSILYAAPPTTDLNERLVEIVENVLRNEQIQVWGEAYDTLDTDAIWERVVGNNYPRAWQAHGINASATLVITCGERIWTSGGSGFDETRMLRDAVTAMAVGDWSPEDDAEWTRANDAEPFQPARWRGWVWTEVTV